MNENVKEINSGHSEIEQSNLESLLEAANANYFNPSESYTGGSQKFEKSSSLFDIVQKEEVFQDHRSENDNSGENENQIREEPSETVDTNNEVFLEEEKDNLDSLNSSEQQNDNIDEVTDTQSSEDNSASDVESPEAGERESAATEFIVQDIASDVHSQSDGSLAKSEVQQSEENRQDKSFSDGYQAAILEFEKSMELEKSSLIDTANAVLNIDIALEEITTQLIKEKVNSLAGNLVGYQIEKFPEDFLKQIEASVDEIISDIRDIKVELNHLDLNTLKNVVDEKNLALRLVEGPELRRGEYKITRGLSGYHQKYSDC